MTIINNQQISNSSKEKFTENRINHWNNMAMNIPTSRSLGGYYHKRLIEIYISIIPKNSTVLEIGCGEGALLASLNPSIGVGIDFSPEMIKRAKKRYPKFKFITQDIHSANIEEKFDYIVLSDLINDLWDVQRVFEIVRSASKQKTRIIINFYSRLWEPVLGLAKVLGLATPTLPQNWFTVDDVSNLLKLSGFEIMKNYREILFPLNIRVISSLLNKFVVKFWPFSYFALTNIVVANVISNPNKLDKNPSVSVIIPARNEAGNIASIFERVPDMGKETELIFVEGHSKDNTYEVIQDQILLNPKRKSRLFRQSGKGKGDAVRKGFNEANGDILMILDADLTVPPEDLPRFYSALINGKGELINGVRLVYPLEEKAMRFINLVGNKIFSLLFSWLLGQPIKDTLCGTKVLWKEDYEKIASHRPYFGEFDPFGDFDLIFNAAKLGLKIVDIPIRYRERTYGNTNIDRWRHGWLLIKMSIIAARKIKFT